MITLEIGTNFKMIEETSKKKIIENKKLWVPLWKFRVKISLPTYKIKGK